MTTQSKFERIATRAGGGISIAPVPNGPPVGLPMFIREKSFPVKMVDASFRRRGIQRTPRNKCHAVPVENLARAMPRRHAHDWTFARGPEQHTRPALPFFPITSSHPEAE